MTLKLNFRILLFPGGFGPSLLILAMVGGNICIAVLVRSNLILAMVVVNIVLPGLNLLGPHRNILKDRPCEMKDLQYLNKVYYYSAIIFAIETCLSCVTSVLQEKIQWVFVVYYSFLVLALILFSRWLRLIIKHPVL